MCQVETRDGKIIKIPCDKVMLRQVLTDVYDDSLVRAQAKWSKSPLHDSGDYGHGRFWTSIWLSLMKTPDAIFMKWYFIRSLRQVGQLAAVRVGTTGDPWGTKHTTCCQLESQWLLPTLPLPALPSPADHAQAIFAESLAEPDFEQLGWCKPFSELTEDDVKAYFVGQGLTPYDRDQLEFCAPYWAAQEGNLPMLRYLVEVMGCTVRRKAPIGVTPIHMSARNGHDKITAYLCDRTKNDPEYLNGLTTAGLGVSPMDGAAVRGHASSIRLVWLVARHAAVLVAIRRYFGSRRLHSMRLALRAMTLPFHALPPLL